MTASADQRMVEEFVAGAEVPDIAARYAVPEAYVDRVVEDASRPQRRRRWDWSWRNLGNRIVYSLAAGTVVNWVAHAYVLGCVVTVVLFVLTSAIVYAKRD